MVAGTITDICLIFVGLLSLFAGWRRGALVGVWSLVGFLLGVWIGTKLVPVVIGWMSDHGWSLADHRALVLMVILLVCALSLQAIGFSLGAAVRRRMGDGIVRGLDSVGGSVVSVFTVALVVWLAAGFIRMTPFTLANSAANDSKVVSALDHVVPAEPDAVIGSVGVFLRRNGFPEVFSGQAEDIQHAPAPSGSVSSDVKDASRSVVKVLGRAPECGHDSEGSGWVASGDRVVTNAHVVAGARRLIVQSGGRAYAAQLVTFDPEHDVAVLHVPGLRTPSLEIGSAATDGQEAVVAGYPGNGGLRLTPARVRETLLARGKNIYGTHSVVRSIYALRAEVREGNSGGPLLDESGRVVGVVFARSTSDTKTGYALTMHEVVRALHASEGESARVSSGSCVAA